MSRYRNGCWGWVVALACTATACGSNEKAPSRDEPLTAEQEEAAQECRRQRKNAREAIKLANKGDMVVELDPNGAIAKYEQAAKLAPNNHRILYKLAKAHKKKEEWDKVASTLHRATDLAPGFANYWFERGYALEQQAKKKTISYQEAIEPYQKCVEADEHYDACHFHLGQIYAFTDRKQDALASYTRAADRRPTEIHYYAALASLYLSLDLGKEARQVLDAAKAMAAPQDKRLVGIHLLLAQLHQDEGDITTAIREMEAARLLGGNENAEVLFQLGSLYVKLSPPRKAEALQLLKGFMARACRSKAAKRYQAECERAMVLSQQLTGG